MSKKKDERPAQDGKDLERSLRNDGPEAARLLLLAALIWLFAVLVFIPMAASTGEEVRLAVTLFLLVAFSLPVYRALPVLKRLLDSLSVPLARKNRFRGRMAHDEAENLVTTLLYVAAGLIVYLFYVPFLLWLQPVFAGIALLCLIIWAALMLVRVMPTVARLIIGWAYS